MRQNTSPRLPLGRQSATDGFTLVELLVVLAIIGLVAALTTPQVLRYLDSAKVDATKVQIKNLEGALELYYIDTGNYPTSDEGLTVLSSRPANAMNWNGPYMRNSETLRDAWGTPYQYRSPADGRPFEVKSLGRDRKAGGTSLDADLQSE